MDSYYKILVLYDPASTGTLTTRDYLLSFKLFSKHNVHYAPATNLYINTFPLKHFDVVILHYSIRLCHDWHISPSYAKALETFQGTKLLFIQDEYDHTEMARSWMDRFQFHFVFTCVPDRYIQQVYPKERFPNTKFVNAFLTGYVPIDYQKLVEFQLPVTKKKIYFAYRGRELPFRYGDLCREKYLIATGVSNYCKEHNISHDISYDESKRIYGRKWYQFIANARAVLGTESGSNVFDFDGSITSDIQAMLSENPLLSYGEVKERYLHQHDNKILMNQISPRIFEAIALKTALVLFEGNYSGVLEPEKHYITLKKDFSNLDEVVSKLKNDSYLMQLTDCVYDDVLQSGLYTYHNFIKRVDDYIEKVTKPQFCLQAHLDLSSELLQNTEHRKVRNTCILDFPLSHATVCQPIAHNLQSKLEFSAHNATIKSIYCFCLSILLLKCRVLVFHFFRTVLRAIARKTPASLKRLFRLYIPSSLLRYLN